MENEVTTLSKEVIALIDTSIKIGFGGIVTLIAGLITYKTTQYITGLNHAHEINKENIKYKIDIAKEKLNINVRILESIIEGIDNYFLSTHKLNDHWFTFSKREPFSVSKLIGDEKTNYIKSSNKYTNEIYECNKIITKMRVIGLKKAADIIHQYDQKFVNRINDFNNNLKQSFNEDEHNTFSTECNELKLQYIDEIEEHYKNI